MSNQANAPTAPAGLTADARIEWRRVVKVLGAAGTLDKADRATIALYCESWSLWRSASSQAALLGEVIQAPSGALYQNPWRGVANRAAAAMARAARELGLTPRARRGMKAKPATKQRAKGLALLSLTDGHDARR